jgi:hypothetical protein
MQFPPLAEKGFLEKTPKEKINIESLLTKTDKGVPTIILIILNEELKHIPKNLLTHEVLSQKDNRGNSAYHLAAQTCQFKEIPKEIINLNVLKEENGQGETIWGTLIRRSQIDQVLPFIEKLIEEEEQEESFLHVCASARELHQIPKEYLTKDRLSKTIKKSHDTVIGYAAYCGCLYQLPRELVNQESMSHRNSRNETPLHMATENGTLHLVPKRFLTQENLEKEDDWGTVFQKAAMNCTFENFPQALLTEENLIKRNKNNGMNPLYILAREYCESSEPDKRKKGKKQLTNLISILSEKNLNSLKNELEVENWLPAVSIIKEEFLKREMGKKLSQSPSLAL